MRRSAKHDQNFASPAQRQHEHRPGRCLHQLAACSPLNADSRLDCSLLWHQAQTALSWHWLLLGSCQSPTAAHHCQSAVLPHAGATYNMHAYCQSRMLSHTLVGLRGPWTPSGMSAIASRICLTCRMQDLSRHHFSLPCVTYSERQHLGHSVLNHGLGDILALSDQLFKLWNISFQQCSFASSARTLPAVSVVHLLLMSATLKMCLCWAKLVGRSPQFCIKCSFCGSVFLCCNLICFLKQHKSVWYCPSDLCASLT